MGSPIRLVIAATLLTACVSAHAQQQAVPVPAAADPLQVSSAPPDIQTLGEVRALPPDEGQPLDLYRFKNPVDLKPNPFDKDWKPPPSIEQVSLSGGYLVQGVYYLEAKAAKGLHTLTGAPDQIQAATARPPPQLSAAQLRRATQLCVQQGAGCDPGQ
ncbi:hypothetical protein [Xanthomonas sp. MUS 060]|uniref:hypothetical protein n=1 Tax=Xanthomonas sp. MUS 060 TaxID=1588031 RepID=UPI0005F27F0B|nr:hypothetical protein [Xanthomonas sp. MUS 060]